MDDEQPTFKVTDRRLFNADGSPRDLPPEEPKPEPKAEPTPTAAPKESHSALHRPTLHYNIQIHLPATKDVEVFNAIFKSLKEHLLE